MADNSACKVEGIGSIQIKMFDGVIRNLSTVHFIPLMKRNLISLSALDEKGYKYSGGHGVQKVSSGSLIVMKGNLRQANDLYYLQETTISGDIIPAIYDNNSIIDSASLWYMRLGHMSEHGLAELNRRGLLYGYNSRS